MSISISLLHSDIKSQLRKYNSAFVGPIEIDLAVNKAQYDVLDQIILEYEGSQKRSSADQDLLKLHTFSGSAEERTLPADVYKLSVVLLGDAEGDILDDKRFNDRINSVILPPSTSRPVATVYNDGVAKIRIMPAATTHRIKYWKVPVTAVHNFTATDGNVVFNPTGSVNVDFPMSEYTRILNQELFYLGMPSASPDAVNLKEQA